MVSIAPASLPEPASVRQKPPSLRPLARSGRNCCLTSSLPNFAIGQQQTEFETLIVTPIDGQMREISSTARQ